MQPFLAVTRARTLPVMAAPVIIGSVLAWQQGSPFNWGLFILTLVGAMAAHLGANVINDVFDFGAGTDQAAQAITHQGSTIATGSRYLLNGKFTITYYRTLAVACFAIALLCGIILTIFRPWALLLGIIGFLLAFFMSLLQFDWHTLVGDWEKLIFSSPLEYYHWSDLSTYKAVQSHISLYLLLSLSDFTQW